MAELVINTTGRDRYCYNGIYVQTPTDYVRMGRHAPGTVVTYLKYDTHGNFGVHQGAALSSAKIKFKCFQSSANPPIVRFYAWDTGVVTDPTSCLEIESPAVGFTPGFVEWTTTPWVADEWYESPELITILQPVIDRADFADIALTILESPNNPQTLPNRVHYFYSLPNQAADNTELRMIYPADSQTPYENFFSCWVEVDSLNDIALSSRTVINWYTMQRTANSYVYKDFGEDYFGDFVIQFETQITAVDTLGLCGVCIVSNTKGTFQDQTSANDGLTPSFSSPDGTEIDINLQDRLLDTGDVVQVDNDPTPMYYATFYRNGQSAKFQLFSDAARETLVYESSILCDDTPFRYLMAVASRDESGSDTISGTVQNLIVNGTGGATLYPVISPNDPFDGVTNDDPDTDLWNLLYPQYQNAPNAGVFINNDLLRMDLIGAPAPAVTLGVRSKWLYQPGDIDVEVSFYRVSANTGQTFLELGFPDVGKSYAMGFQHHTYRIVQNGSFISIGGVPPAIGVLGKVRITKVGSVITGYKWEGGAWVVAYNFSQGSQGTGRMQITIFTNDGARNTVIDFDDFITNVSPGTI